MTQVRDWRIRIAGYGTFSFSGTRELAEARMRSKARWEGGVGTMWPADPITKSEKIEKEIGEAFERGEGVSGSRFAALRKARADEVAA